MYLLDVDRARLTYPDLVRKVIAHKAMWNADHVIVEGGDQARSSSSSCGAIIAILPFSRARPASPTRRLG